METDSLRYILYVCYVTVNIVANKNDSEVFSFSHDIFEGIFRRISFSRFTKITRTACSPTVCASVGSHQILAPVGVVVSISYTVR